MSIRARELRQRILETMNTDAERFRFLADHKLTLHANGEHYAVHSIPRFRCQSHAQRVSFLSLRLDGDRW
jgi:hypothetical protein